MLAQPADHISLEDGGLAYEPKLDGIRAIACASKGQVRLYARSGADKTATFPEIVKAIEVFYQAFQCPITLDGEIVPIRPDGTYGTFQDLQGRIGLTKGVTQAAKAQPCAYVVFDMPEPATSTLREPWIKRRTRLANMMRRLPPLASLRQIETCPQDGRELFARGQREGWEGIMAKRVMSTYKPGRRTSDWMKLDF